MIDGSEKLNRQLAFELQNSHVCEKRSRFCGSAYKTYMCWCQTATSQRVTNHYFLSERSEADEGLC